MTVSYLGAAADTAAVDAAIRAFLTERRVEADALGEDFAAMVAELESYVLRGGKRIRPTFAWLGWIGAGGDPHDPVATAVLSACAGFELLHASCLIHDDIIDASRTRRGHPAAHVTYAERHRTRRFSGDPDAFGTGTAILIGDLALIWADVLVREAGLPADAHARVSPVWSAVRSEVVYGQLLDLINQASGDEDIDAALRVDQYKTASYTVERPLQFGAAIAGAEADLVAAYRAFGADIGIAFQLRDDLLGVFGDPAVTGKPSGDDLREGKRTVLLATALERADRHDPDAAGFLRAKLGTDLSDDELARVRAILVDVGAVEHIEGQIALRADRALAVLEASSVTRPAKHQLAEMAIKATQRAQ
ncbi:polyprenyl synthetase family protein [Micromonospora sagamiensis]|uniref:Geranylgeranyl diphosphate synthase type I n=1 Tax=Micromonospora sagamiensis TaxID=47875 RepID=A0A562WCG7_9ACTN|nr:polyprenyl synthetase family protein [Micromonospora sagamiensis]TWJ27647.1 geranylgeranyl diphosphate synthase type I [Micromonospora sagamiensis]BCL13467.1 geranylgeranyl pyrophosphate synthase [Micromonospora sagamiensis]